MSKIDLMVGPQGQSVSEWSHLAQSIGRWIPTSYSHCSEMCLSKMLNPRLTKKS